MGTSYFAYLMVIIYLGTGLGLMSAANYKSYGLTHVEDEHFFTLVGSLGGFFNGLSRFFWSFVLDYFSNTWVLRCNLLLYVATSLTIELIAGSKVLLMLWIIMIYFQYGGMYTYFPTVTTKVRSFYQISFLSDLRQETRPRDLQPILHRSGSLKRHAVLAGQVRLTRRGLGRHLLHLRRGRSTRPLNSGCLPVDQRRLEEQNRKCELI